MPKIITEVSKRGINKIIIVGCGDSWFVGSSVRFLFEQLLGISTESIQALEYYLYYYHATDHQTLVIGVSSSGNTKAVSQALQRAKERNALTLGVTNNKESSFHKLTDLNILVQASRKGWPTQSSTSTTIALISLAHEISLLSESSTANLMTNYKANIKRLPSLVDSIIKDFDQPMKGLAEELITCRLFLFTGAGPSLAIANIAAAKVRELSPHHAFSIPLEEFHNYRSVKRGDILFIIETDSVYIDRVLETAQVANHYGARVATFTSDHSRDLAEQSQWIYYLPYSDDIFSPIIYSIPFHWFAYHLAMVNFNN